MKELINVLGSKGIIVWNERFEGILSELANKFPDQTSNIDKIIDRVYDLAPLFKNYYFHPGFLGSYGLKQVTETLLNDISYKNLDISDGATATASWLKMINSKDDGLRLDISFDLHKYCEQDTLVMVKLYEHIKELTYSDQLIEV